MDAQQIATARLRAACAIGAAASIALAACANPLNDATYTRYTNAGIAEHRRGNLVAAEEAHRRAVINARIGHLGDEKEALALHNLALVKRDLCKLAEAEDLFRRALELRDKHSDTPADHLSGTLFELAQLYYETRRATMAVPLTERGLPIVEGAGAERVAPAELARILTEYADGLGALKRSADAETVRARIRALVAERRLSLDAKPSGPPFNHPACP